MPISNLGNGLRTGVCTSTNRPTTPYEGQVIYETDTDKVFVWNGSAWVIPNSPAQNPTGLELVTTATCSSGGTASGGVVTIGSGVSSVTVSSAFSSTYDNYLVTMAGGSCSANAVIGMQLGATVSGYYSQFIYTSWNNTVQADSSAGATNRFIYAGGTSANGHNMSYTVMSPNLPNSTRANGWGGEGTSYIGFHNGWLNNTTQYTSFTITPTAGTLTGGTIRVYGYRNS